MKKILLNWLPPASIETPSPALSILKSFLEINKYKVDIKYWNILFHNLMSKYRSENENSDIIDFVPFMSVLAENSADSILESRLECLLQKAKPHFYLTGKEHYSKFLKNVRNDILKIIDDEIKNISNDYLLVGFSSKFYQWIPAQIVATSFKSKSPDTKIIIGGFGNRNEALAVMELHEEFDFAIWGEGEYPLLELCNQLVNNLIDFQNIPGLIHRSNSKLYMPKNISKRYIDLNASPIPDFTDYFKQLSSIPDKIEINLPLESSRSCHWQKCKFCFLNEGYRYRQKDPDNVLREIQTLSEIHKISKFLFLDNDLIGKSWNNFDRLLDGFINHKAHIDPNFEIVMAEIIPKNLNANIIKKMAKSGIRYVQAGYESTSDSLLVKMNKKSRFADNILFVKWALKYGIGIGETNVIINLVDETESDIIESIKNLHFLRFYLSSNKLSHRTTPLAITCTSRYFKTISQNELDQWDTNMQVTYLPDNYFSKSNRFNLFDYYKNSQHKRWSDFKEINKHYNEKLYEYKLLMVDNIAMFEEYYNHELINSISFTDHVYWEILKTANHEVMSLDLLHTNISNRGFNINQHQLIEVVNNLKNGYLLYANNDLSELVSVIDTDTII